MRARLYVVPTWLVRCNWFAVMAIYHLSVKVISRSAGRSAVAAAAYRCAGRLRRRTGRHYQPARQTVCVQTP